MEGSVSTFALLVNSASLIAVSIIYREDVQRLIVNGLKYVTVKNAETKRDFMFIVYLVVAMARSINQETALRFSFLLFIPSSLSGAVLSITDIVKDDISFYGYPLHHGFSGLSSCFVFFT